MDRKYDMKRQRKEKERERERERGGGEGKRERMLSSHRSLYILHFK